MPGAIKQPRFVRGVDGTPIVVRLSEIYFRNGRAFDARIHEREREREMLLGIPDFR
jgi:hypothetical protein